MFHLGKSKTNIIRSQSGNAMLYAMAILPMAMMLTMIGVDLSKWQNLRQVAQSEADRIALQAAQILPHAAQAEQFVKDSVATFNMTHGNGTYNFHIPEEMLANGFTSSSVITVTIAGAVDTGYTTGDKEKKGLNFELKINESSTAGVVPTDYALVVSDSVRYRPPAKTTWGFPGSWPASSYFNQIGKPNLSFDNPLEEPLHWPNWWKDDFDTTEYKRWATQLCYNPAFSPLKLAAISVAEYALSAEQDKLSVMFTPGDNPAGEGFTELRDMFYPNDPNAIINWNNSFYEREIAHSDEACLYYASPQTAVAQHYTIPDTATSGTSVPCEERVTIDPFIDERGHRPDPTEQRLAECFREDGGATLREAIYYHAARPFTNTTNGNNIARAIYISIIRLYGLNNNAAINDQVVRRNLSAFTRRKLIIITDEIPALNQIIYSNGPLAGVSLKNFLAELTTGGRLSEKPLTLTFIRYWPEEFLGEAPSITSVSESWASASVAGFDIEIKDATEPSDLNYLVPQVLRQKRRVALRD